MEKLDPTQLKKRIKTIAAILQRSRNSFEILKGFDEHWAKRSRIDARFGQFLFETQMAHWRQLHMSLALLADKQKAEKIGIPWLMDYATGNPDQFKHFSLSQLEKVLKEFPKLDAHIAKLGELRNQWYAHLNEKECGRLASFLTKNGLTLSDTQEVIDAFCAILNVICGCEGTRRLVAPTSERIVGNMQELFDLLSAKNPESQPVFVDTCDD